MHSRSVSIIIPSFNEEKLIVPLLDKVVALRLPEGIDKEIIVVDDGSHDSTAERIEAFIDDHPEAGIRFFRHPLNRGKGAAVRTGFAAATGEVLIVQDADLEYDPEEIPRVIEPVLRGDAEVVYGSRILHDKALGRSGILGWLTGKHPDSDFMAYLGGVAVTRFANLLTGAKLTDEPTCYKCFHRSVLRGLTIEGDDFSWEPEVSMKILRQGYHIHEVPISYHPRRKAEGKKISWLDGFKALATLLRYRCVELETVSEFREVVAKTGEASEPAAGECELPRASTTR